MSKLLLQNTRLRALHAENIGFSYGKEVQLPSCVAGCFPRTASSLQVRRGHHQARSLDLIRDVHLDGGRRVVGVLNLLFECLMEIRVDCLVIATNCFSMSTSKGEAIRVYLF